MTSSETNLVEVYLNILKEDPYNEIAIDTLSFYYYNTGQHEKTVQLLTPIIEKNPDHVRLSNRGLAYTELNRPYEAADDYTRALELSPDDANIWNNAADLFRTLMQYDRSLDACDKAIALNPKFIEPLGIKGCVYSELREYKKSNDYFEAALAIDPTNSDVLFPYSLNLLLMGDYPKGFSYYENRHTSNVSNKNRRYFREPVWHKYLDLKGKTLLIYADQGLGDCIQMSRFLKSMSGTGAKIIVEVEESLVDLFKTIPGDHIVVASGLTPSGMFDYQFPIMSFPLQLDVTIDTIPHSNGYIKADREKVNKWNNNLGEKTVPRIGVAWSGFKSTSRDQLRSMSFEEFSKCLPIGPKYFYLQPTVRSSDIECLRTRTDLMGLCDYLTDFTETAALIENLDLIITVDTSVAHLAGAMGKPTWVLLQYAPDWRWGASGNTTPWYSSVKLFRQTTFNSWENVINQINENIQSNQLN